MKCDADVKEQAADMKYCGLIKTTDGPLGDCVNCKALDTDALYESCVIDYCAYYDKPESLGEVICNALSAFATSCEERDLGGAWRTVDRCGK